MGNRIHPSIFFFRRTSADIRKMEFKGKDAGCQFFWIFLKLLIVSARCKNMNPACATSKPVCGYSVRGKKLPKPVPQPHLFYTERTKKFDFYLKKVVISNTFLLLCNTA